MSYDYNYAITFDYILKPVKETLGKSKLKHYSTNRKPWH